MWVTTSTRTTLIWTLSGEPLGWHLDLCTVKPSKATRVSAQPQNSAQSLGCTFYLLMLFLHCLPPTCALAFNIDRGFTCYSGQVRPFKVFSAIFLVQLIMIWEVQPQKGLTESISLFLTISSCAAGTVMPSIPMIWRMSSSDTHQELSKLKPMPHAMSSTRKIFSSTCHAR